MGQRVRGLGLRPGLKMLGEGDAFAFEAAVEIDGEEGGLAEFTQLQVINIARLSA